MIFGFSLDGCLSSAMQGKGKSVIAALLFVLCLTGAASAQSLTVLHNYQETDGKSPGQLMQASNGFLYGTTTFGGAGGGGTIFRQDFAGNITILHSFNGTDGDAPQGPLVQGPDGFLYGTTSGGGQFGDGTAFKIDAAGNFTTLHNFGPAPNPVFPSAPILARDGFFYGTSGNGGQFNQGTVWTMDRLGNVLVLHSFNGADGNGARGLFQAADNLFYGVAQGGGVGDFPNGVAYKIDALGNFTLLHTFTGTGINRPIDGAAPQARFIQASDGLLYSTTSKGGVYNRGTIFKMDAGGNVTLLHSFDDYATTGSSPGGLILGSDGQIYGTTQQGGPGAGHLSGYGVIFRTDTTGNVTVLHTFSIYDGERPFGLLQASDGNLYGGTGRGGTSNHGDGVLYKLELGAPVNQFLVTTSPPHSEQGGIGINGYVILSGFAPANASITLTSSNTQAATVPQSVQIPAGGRNVSFLIQTSAVSTLTNVVITASWNGVTQQTTLQVRPNGSQCSLTLSPSEGLHIGAAGGAGSLSINTLSHCSWAAGTASSSNWITITSPTQGTGAATLTFNVAPNTGAARNGTIAVSAILFRVYQDAGSTGACSVAPMSIGQTVNGALTTSDCFSPSIGYQDYWADQYSFNATAGQEVALLLTSSAFNSYLVLRDPNGTIIEVDDNGGNGGAGDARIPADAGFLPIKMSGTYVVEVTTYRSGDLGSYQLTLSEAVNCSYSITPTTAQYAASGGSSSVSVSSPGLCQWTARSNVPSWLIITGGASGAGNGTVNFLIAANTTTTPRTGTLTIAGQTFTVTQSGVTRLFDFTGDGRADVSVWQPKTGNWVLINSATGETVVRANLGNASLGDVTVPGDYDGDHQADAAVYRPGEGNWYIIQSTDNTLVTTHWGMSGDRPVPGDYDGDGHTDIAIFRQSNSTWYILKSSNGAMVSQPWGMANDKVVPGDYDGDGHTDIAVYRPSNGTWYIIQSTDNSMVAYNWGLSEDKPVPGDYDGDGKTDIAVYRPSTRTWYIIQSTDRATLAYNWGANKDVPVPGDYDGDGHTDVAVYRPSEGNWYIIQSTDGSMAVKHLGASGDLPLPSSFIE